MCVICLQRVPSEMRWSTSASLLGRKTRHFCGSRPALFHAQRLRHTTGPRHTETCACPERTNWAQKRWDWCALLLLHPLYTVLSAHFGPMIELSESTAHCLCNSLHTNKELYSVSPLRWAFSWSDRGTRQQCWLVSHCLRSLSSTRWVDHGKKATAFVAQRIGRKS